MFTPIQLAFMKGFLYALGRQKKKLAQDDAKWITVHPNGQGHKGRPALIDTASGEVLGGMGGKFNGRHISAVKRGHEQAGAQMNVNRMNHKADMMNNQKIGFTSKTSKDIEKQKIAERSNEYMKRYIQNSTREINKLDNLSDEEKKQFIAQLKDPNVVSKIKRMTDGIANVDVSHELHGTLSYQDIINKPFGSLETDYNDGPLEQASKLSQERKHKDAVKQRKLNNQQKQKSYEQNLHNKTDKVQIDFSQSTPQDILKQSDDIVDKLMDLKTPKGNPYGKGSEVHQAIANVQYWQNSLKGAVNDTERANEAKSLQKAVQEASLVLQKKSPIAKPEGYEERKKAREASLKRRADLAQQHADTMQRKVEEAGKKWDDEWQYQKETGREFGQPNVAGRMNSAQNALQRKQDAYMNAKQEAEKAQYRADNLKHADYKIKGSGERARGDLQDRIYNNQVKKQEFLDAAKALSKAKTIDEFKNISKSLTISADNSELKSYINDSIDHEINKMANARNGYAHEYIGSVENAIKGQIAGLKAKASQIQSLIRKDQKRFDSSQANSSVSAPTSSFNTRLGDVSFAKNGKGESLAVLKTNGIPSKEDRAMLKSRRFRWNPDLKAWTVKATEDQSDFIKNFIG